MQQVYATNDGTIVHIVKTANCYNFATFSTYWETLELNSDTTWNTLEETKLEVERVYGDGNWVDFSPKVTTKTKYTLNIK